VRVEREREKVCVNMCVNMCVDRAPRRESLKERKKGVIKPYLWFSELI